MAKIQEDLPSLFESYTDYFRVGAAMNHFTLLQQTQETELVKKHFNLIVAENATKMENIYLAENRFNFSIADRFLDFGRKNNKAMRWHTLLHSDEMPAWIFRDEDDQFVSKEVLNNRLKNYIQIIMDHTKNDICSYDVISEAISDMTFGLRNKTENSYWYHIIGSEYVENAFNWAHEANPKAELVLNEYNLESSNGKRDGTYQIVKSLLAKKVPISAIGVQMHISLNYPQIDEIEKTFELFGSLGLQVIVSEMDISVYEFPETETKEYTKELLDRQAQRYYDLFECFKKYAKKGILKDVVVWGISDKSSWKNNFPIPKRTDIPLLFDNNCLAKPAFYSLIK